MKAILISIWAFWASLILNGKKTIEVRKGTRLHKAIQKLIKEQGKAIIYLYVCKGKDKLHKNIADIYWVDDKYFRAKNKRLGIMPQPDFNGKVVAKFEATSELIKYHFLKKRNIYYVAKFVSEYTTPTLTNSQLKERSCLSTSELEKYLDGPLEEKNIVGTAVHIVPNSLKVFDKPKEIKEFKTKLHIKGGCKNCPQNTGFSMPYCKTCDFLLPLVNAPQSWCYIEVEK